jgi:hypothetical protein
MIVALVVLFGALLTFDLLRIARRGPGAPAVLLAAIPRALLSVAAAVTIGAFNLRAAFTEIARFGSGGVTSVLGPSADLVRLTFAGALTCAALLAVALVIAWSADAAKTTAGAPPPRLLLTLLVVGVVLTAGYSAYAVISAERASLGIVVPLAVTVSVPPPAGYDYLVRESGQAQAVTIGHLINATTTGGLALCAVLAGLIVSTARLGRYAGMSGPWRVAMPAAALAVIAFAAWRAIHLGTVLGWLNAFAARIG